jgi:Fe-S-cluster containining protein
MFLCLGGTTMSLVSWRKVKSWNCVECGMCCRDYHVVLNFNEWINIVRNYGAEATIPSVSKLFLGKKDDGTCIFLNNLQNGCSCGLQHMKPLACKIWPFKVFDKPKFGMANEALFNYRDNNFYVYVDPECTGLRWGTPDSEFKHRVLPEFIDVAVGLRRNQFYSTSKIQCQLGSYVFRGRRVI